MKPLRCAFWLWLAAVAMGRALRVSPDCASVLDRALVEGYRKAGLPLPGRLRVVA